MMIPARTPWEVRLDWSLSALHWVALGLGLFVTLIVSGATAGVTVAALGSGAYVLVMQLLPRRVRHGDIVGELMAVTGVVVALVAVSLTGGIDSPYVFFLAGPSFFAGAFLGFRIGMETALLSGTGLLAVVAGLGQEIVSGSVIQALALYVLIALTFSQARRLLIEERARGDALAAADEATRSRMQRLQAAHSLLKSLGELANATELNPLSVGDAALRDLAVMVPFRAGEVVLNEEGGALVVARRGDLDGVGIRQSFPMVMGGRRLGHLELIMSDEGEVQLFADTIQEALRPVAMAFDNILLLQQIARRAVREERTRVARDLHDEIGPSLASLGLAIDMAIHQHEPGPELARHLESVRRHVTTLVENVRRTVADLRHESTDSILDQAYELAAGAGPEAPAIVVELTERRPPPTSIAKDLAAILTEAVRNAVAHSEARSIHISGEVDRVSGWLRVSDDGKGFDADIVPEGHFGLLGMKERAARIEADLAVDSGPGRGTSITAHWGDTRMANA